MANGILLMKITGIGLSQHLDPCHFKMGQLEVGIVFAGLHFPHDFVTLMNCEASESPSRLRAPKSAGVFSVHKFR